MVLPLDLSGATPRICGVLVLSDIYRQSDQGIVRPGDEQFSLQSLRLINFAGKATIVANGKSKTNCYISIGICCLSQIR